MIAETNIDFYVFRIPSYCGFAPEMTLEVLLEEVSKVSYSETTPHQSTYIYSAHLCMYVDMC